ncbi:MAG: MBL fold metallo-hydrolase [Rhodobacterales bacterium]|nr:MAG: MBL fold metallo-hydrolase [Rhodobacterales bacterium]
MKLTRRTLITSAMATGATAALGQRLWANTTLEAGTTRIDTLSDGNLVLPGDFILGPMPEEEAAAILADYGLGTDELTPDCNLTLLRDGTNTVVFDAGSGANFQPTAGRIWDALDAIGLDPGDVTHVVFTHAHPDHLWGVLDDFDEPVFFNATHMMGAAEHAYWTDPATVDTIGQERLAFAAGAARYLEAIANGLVLFEDGDEVLPGVTARMTPGHTPGHMSFDVTVGDGIVTVIGDAIGNHHVAFARPQWPSGSDQDQPLAAQTRVALMEDFAASGRSFVGFHLPAPGIGTAEKDGEGYRFVPAT